jgi:hypothetical protein
MEEKLFAKKSFFAFCSLLAAGRLDFSRNKSLGVETIETKAKFCAIFEVERTYRCFESKSGHQTVKSFYSSKTKARSCKQSRRPAMYTVVQWKG